MLTGVAMAHMNYVILFISLQEEDGVVVHFNSDSICLLLIISSQKSFWTCCLISYDQSYESYVICQDYVLGTGRVLFSGGHGAICPFFH